MEQILILRKLNIGIRDIKRVFDTTDSSAVLEVLDKKTSDIDDEVALLHELIFATAQQNGRIVSYERLAQPKRKCL